MRFQKIGMRLKIVRSKTVRAVVNKALWMSCEIVQAPCNLCANLTDERRTYRSVPSLTYKIWHLRDKRTANLCQLYVGHSKLCRLRAILTRTYNVLSPCGACACPLRIQNEGKIATGSRDCSNLRGGASCGLKFR